MRPFRLRAYLKDTLWGGGRIAVFKGLPETPPRIGESWELSAMPGCESVVADGEDAGLTLTQLVERHGAALVGPRVWTQFGTRFPLLVKLIDARDDLSIQVHPDEELARRRHGCAGKTEMWYVLDAAPGAKIRAGLNRPLAPRDLADLAADGARTIVDSIRSYESRAGDVYFIPAGTLHSIGAGNLLVEVQQASDVTYRVYDYGRRDAEGRTRELHTDLAKEAIDGSVGAPCRKTYDDRLPVAPLVECPYFRTVRAVVRGASDIDLKTEAFVAVICLAGAADVNGVTARQGETLLVPAIANVLHVAGDATLLCVTL